MEVRGSYNHHNYDYINLSFIKCSQNCADEKELSKKRMLKLQLPEPTIDTERMLKYNLNNNYGMQLDPSNARHKQDIFLFNSEIFTPSKWSFITMEEAAYRFVEF